MKKSSLAAVAVLLIPFISLAHEGHGATEGFTITHYFVEPVHLLYTLAFGVASYFAISFYRKGKKEAGK
jgi:hydrogenase/urease accessory protein HupE